MKYFLPLFQLSLGTIGIISFWNFDWAMQIISIVFLIILIAYSFTIEWIRYKIKEEDVFDANQKETAEVK